MRIILTVYAGVGAAASSSAMTSSMSSFSATARAVVRLSPEIITQAG